jgi:D-alanyl-lipoteichoic acid acyltransferase DltB (MBOAT superfamily)
VRYLYVPLGGTHRLVATSVLIFTFVALWHDLSPRLLAWGWLAALFILPEVMARKTLPPSMVRASRLALDPLWIENAARTSLLSFSHLFVVRSLGNDGGIVTRVLLAVSLIS